MGIALNVTLATSKHCAGNVPTYDLHRIDVSETVQDVVLVGTINDSGQIALFVDGSSPVAGYPLRIEPNGAITLCQPFGSHADVVMEDGRLICDYTESTGFAGYAVGSPSGYTLLRYPQGLPIDGMAANAASRDGTVVGGASGYMVTWSGPDFSPTVLGRLNNRETTALAVSRTGKYLAGVSGLDGVTTPFVYSNGVFTPIPLPPTLVEAKATGVNDDGVVIGYGIDAPNNLRRGFIYRNGTVTWLDPLDSFRYSSPASINDNGLIVGNTDRSAALWDLDGNSYQLNDLAGVDTSRVDIGYAYSINDRNEISGDGASLDYLGEVVPFLLTPVVPDPTLPALALLPTPLLLRPRRPTPAA